LLADTALATRKFRAQQLPCSVLQILLARLRAVGSLGYYLGYHLLRYYLPVQLLAVCIYPPLGLVTLLMLLGVGAVDWGVRRPQLSLPAFYFYYFLEQLSYGTGVFRGCLEMKSFSCYRLNLQDARASA
jgi:mycofactocin glycosyltransferase